jgi:hypothetical protein
MFKNVVIVILASIFSACAVYEPRAGKSSADTALYDGLITLGSVTSFLESVKDKRITILRINSNGGDVAAGMLLGDWVFANNISVHVPKLCLSSCANYIFSAANLKVIEEGAVVAWHGSVEQANFRYMDARYSNTKKRSERGEQLSLDDSLELRDEAKLNRYTNSQKLRKIQQEFFKKILVSEYITRAGQEPVFLERPWTLSAKDLQAFGICNVIQPKSYAANDYLWKFEVSQKIPIVHLPLNSEVQKMLVSELEKNKTNIQKCKD